MGMVCKKTALLTGMGCLLAVAANEIRAAAAELQRLPLKGYRRKVKAGWIGQIIGVSRGVPTGGKFTRIMPAEKMPPLREELMDYGDGLCAGQVIGARYAEAYSQKNVHKLIDAGGLRATPSQCLYAEMVRDGVRWHRENPTDWEKI